MKMLMVQNLLVPFAILLRTVYLVSAKKATIISSSPAILKDTFESSVMQSRYVDKTLLIKEIIEDDHDLIIITRPPGWGKTFNVDMMKAFFNDNSTSVLFTGGEIKPVNEKPVMLKPLKISQHEDVMKYQGKYPVVKINLRRIFSFNNEAKITYSKVKFMMLFELRWYFCGFEYLRDFVSGDETMVEKFDKYAKYSGRMDTHSEIAKEDLIDGLRFLSELLYKYRGNKVYIIIENFEAPFLSRLKNGPSEYEIEAAMVLFRSIYLRLMTGRKYIEKVVFTGVYIPADFEDKVLSHLNASILRNSLLDEKFSEYFGFRQHEVDGLLAEFTPKRRRDLEFFISYWFKAFNYTGLVYSPYSIRDCFTYQDIGKLSRPFTAFEYLMNLPFVEDAIGAMQEDAQKLFMGESILYPIVPLTCDNIREIPNTPNVLLFYGLLNPVYKEGNNVCLNVSTNDAKLWFYSAIVSWFQNELGMYEDYCDYRDSLIAGDLDTFQDVWTNHTKNVEMNVTHCNAFMIMVFAGNRYQRNPYIIQWDKQNRTGSLVVVMVPKTFAPVNDTAIVVAYQLASDENVKSVAMQFTEQIKTLYIDRIKKFEGIKKVRVIGLAFHRCNVTGHCIEEDIPREGSF